VALHATRAPSGTVFTLTDADGSRPHLTGSLRST
jgi:hypothetical protein